MRGLRGGPAERDAARPRRDRHGVPRAASEPGGGSLGPGRTPRQSQRIWSNEIPPRNVISPVEKPNWS